MVIYIYTFPLSPATTPNSATTTIHFCLVTDCCLHPPPPHTQPTQTTTFFSVFLSPCPYIFLTIKTQPLLSSHPIPPYFPSVPPPTSPTLPLLAIPSYLASSLQLSHNTDPSPPFPQHNPCCLKPQI